MAKTTKETSEQIVDGKELEKQMHELIGSIESAERDFENTAKKIRELQESAEASREEYRRHLYDGRKVEADKCLENVAEFTKQAEKLIKDIAEKFQNMPGDFDQRTQELHLKSLALHKSTFEILESAKKTHNYACQLMGTVTNIDSKNNKFKYLLEKFQP